MGSDDLTVEILKQIRDGIAGMREDVNTRLDSVNVRLDRVEGELGQVKGELGQVKQGLNDLGQFMRQIALGQAEYEKFHAHHVELLEKDVEDIRARLLRLEQKSV